MTAPCGMTAPSGLLREHLVIGRLRATRRLAMTISASRATSIWRLLSRALRLRRLDPPGEIIGEPGERELQRLAGPPDRLGAFGQGLPNRPHRVRARNHHHAPLPDRARPRGG